MLNSNFSNFLDFVKDKNVLITSHDFVDIDGFASCHVLKFFLNKYYKNDKAFIHLNKFSKSTLNFIEKFTIKFPTYNISLYPPPDVSKIDVILILDTHNIAHVQNENNFNKLIPKIPHIYIDHHYESKTKDFEGSNSLNLIYDDFTSTSEILYEMLISQSIEIKPPYNYLIIAGILADSGYLKYGNNDTILRVSKLLDDDLNFQDILLMLAQSEDLSEKIAKIKGLQRVKMIREDPWLVGISHVGSYEAKVASMLIKIGFDVSVVYSEDKQEFRISSRARRKVCLETKLNLGKIFEEVSNKFEGTGGGHIGAAAFKGKKDMMKIVNDIIERVSKTIKI